MEEKKISPLFRAIKGLVKIVYPQMDIEGMANLPEEPVVIVGNHTQLHGPVACELYFSHEYYTWCAAQMMHLKEVPAYAYEDFWSRKPKWTRPFYKLLAYMIAPLSVCVFNNARTIAVYHNMKIISTFKNTVRILKSGGNVIIFPEHDKKYNNIVYDFQENFIDIAKLYYKNTGKELKFVPMYIAPNLRKMYIGKPTGYCADIPMEEERKRICTYLMEEITKIARSLPVHKVVPYRNIPKKYYPLNTDSEVTDYEKTGC